MRRGTVLIALGLIAVAVAATLWLTSRGGAALGTDASRDELPVVSQPNSAAPASLEASPRVALRGVCVLSGTISRAAKPIAADVELLAEGTVVHRATAGADGRFVVSGVPAGDYFVQAATSDGARGSIGTSLALDGARVDVSIEVSAAIHELRGTVKYDDGTAFSGAVRIAPIEEISDHEDRGWGSMTRPVAGRTSTASLDAKGAFVVAHLVAGTYRVEYSSGPARVQRWARVPGNEIALTVPRVLDAVEGVVVDGGTSEPVAGADVRWRGDFAEVGKTSDGEGRFLVPAGGTHLVVAARGFVEVTANLRDAEVPLRIALQRSATVRGRATSASDGKPVVGLAVTAGTATSWHLGTASASTTTDADGRYELAGLAPGEILVRANSPLGVARGTADISPDDGGPIQSDPLAVDVDAGSVATLDLVIEAGARVEGAVRDADGKPVEGVVVEARCPARSYLHSTNPTRWWEKADAVTDREGRYELRGLIPGRYYFLEARRGGQSVSSGVDTSTTGEVERVDLTFDPVEMLDVRVVDGSTGKGIEGVVVVAWLQRSAEHSEWRTGEEGRVRVGPISRGEVELQLSYEEEWKVEDSVTATIPAPGVVPAVTIVATRREPQPVDPELAALAKPAAAPATAKSTSPLRVRVLDVDGHRVPRAIVAWKTDSEEGSEAVVAGVAVIERAVDDGAASITTIEVSLPDGRPRPLVSGDGPVVPAGVSDIEVRVAKPVDVVGRIVDADGRGVGGVRVAFRVPGLDARHRSLRAGGSRRQGRRFASSGDTAARSDAQGRFRIEDVGADDGALVVNSIRRYAEVVPLVVTPGRAPVEIRLHASMDARVVVTDAGGRGVAVLEVMALVTDHGPRGISNLEWTSRAGRATTDDDGVAALHDLDPERTYSVWVKRRRGGSAGEQEEREICLDDWSPRGRPTLAVRFNAPRKVRGIVKTPQGMPIDGAHVVGYVGSKSKVYGETAADGRFSLDDDGMGTLRVYATMADWGRARRSSVVDPKDEEPIALTIDPGVELTVRVDGEIVAKRRVLLSVDQEADWNDKSEYQIGQTDDAGRFRFRGLDPEKTYFVYVAPRTDENLSSSNGDESGALVAGVKGGDARTEIRVRLEPGGRIVAVPPAGMEWSTPSIMARHGRMSVRGKQLDDGTLEFRGLLDVEWDLEVSEWGGGQSAVGKARPGQTVELERVTTISR